MKLSATTILVLLVDRVKFVSCGLLGRQSLANTTTGAVNTTQPTANAPAATSSAVFFNPDNLSCEEVNGAAIDSATLWAKLGSDQALDKFFDLFHNDLQYCKECFGQSTQGCQNTTAIDCNVGLRTRSSGRVDRAAGLFAENNDNLLCQVETPNGCDPGACSAERGPALYAIVESITNLHLSLNQIYQAISEAHSEAQDVMSEFTSNFAPLPAKDNSDLFISFFESIVNGIAGLEETGIASAGVGIAEAAFSLADINDPPDPSEPDNSILGDVVGKIKSAYSKYGDDTFSGNASGSTDVLATTLKDGAFFHLSGDQNNLYPDLKKNYKRLIFQQLANVTWVNNQIDGVQHFPFITFDPMSCAEVDADKSKSIFAAFNFDKPFISMDSHIDYQGRCYYLLDAVLQVIPYLPVGDGDVGLDTYECTPQALPGGTVTYLSSLGDGPYGDGPFGGLSIWDFIVPSVEGWANNGNKNGYKPSFTAGNRPASIEQPGMVTIPVCDYTNDVGPGCPDLNSADENGCIIT